MGYVYKYINKDNSIEYIGKTTNTIEERIKNHSCTDIKDFSGTIYYAEVTDNFELDIIEKVLINKYKPKRNKLYAQTSIFSIDESQLIWQKFYKKSKPIVYLNTTCFIDLKRLLAYNNMTQTKLAELAGIRSATICDMCNGKTKLISLENIAKICTVLECSVNDLIKIVGKQE